MHLIAARGITEVYGKSEPLMHRRWLLLVFALLLVGCSQAGKQQEETPPPPPPAVQDGMAHSRSAEEWNELSYEQIQQGQFDQAVDSARKALALKPDFPYAQYNLGWALLQTNEWRGAREPLEATMKAQPGRPEPLHALALWHQRSGSPGQAAAYLQVAAALGYEPAKQGLAASPWRSVVSKPLWGEPGVVVRMQEGERTILLSRTYAPLIYQGETLQPVQTWQGLALYQTAGNQVTSAGTESRRGGLHLSDQPVPLYTLPLMPGATWKAGGDDLTAPGDMTFTGFEEIQTPAGRFYSVVLEYRERNDVHREWWSPGIGLVKYQRGDRVLTATAIERETPQPIWALARLDEQTTGLLLDDYHQFRVVSQDGRTLFELQNTYWRFFLHWEELDGPAPVLMYATFPGSYGVWNYGAFGYSRQTGTLESLQWLLPDGSRLRSLTGQEGRAEGSPPVDGRAFYLHDFTTYPALYYAFRYDGEAMRTPWVFERYQADEERFAQLITSPVLGEEDWGRLFADPALGREVYRQNQMQLQFASLKQQAPGVWRAETWQGEPMAAFRMVRTERDWRITDWTWTK